LEKSEEGESSGGIWGLLKAFKSFFLVAVWFILGAIFFIRYAPQPAVNILFIMMAFYCGFTFLPVRDIGRGLIEEIKEGLRKKRDAEDRKRALESKQNKEEKKKKEGESDSSGITK